jgi:hypothetical protein
MNTRKLENFGYRELDLARELLNAMIDEGLPEGFDPDGVAIEFNPDSGYVFLVNNEFQVAMMNGDSLELYYILPHSGEEGFRDELEELDLNELHPDDQQYLKDIVL